jgi:hypothetical protein
MEFVTPSSHFSPPLGAVTVKGAVVVLAPATMPSFDWNQATCAITSFNWDSRSLSDAAEAAEGITSNRRAIGRVSRARAFINDSDT